MAALIPCSNQTTLPGKRDDSKPRSIPATLAPFPTEPVYYRVSSDSSQLRTGQKVSRRDPSANHSLVSPDISPPDTPTSQDRGLDSCGSSQISPVDEDPHYRLQGRQMDVKFASHLPVLRKDGRKENARPSQDHKRGTRWDDYSGEPTLDSSGKTAQVAPGSAPFAVKSGGGHSSRVLNWGKEQLQPRKKSAEVRRQLSSQDQDAHPVRDPWKGPSGRAPAMGPIHEQPRSRSRSTSRFQVFKSSGGSKEDEADQNDAPDTTDSLQPKVLTTITAAAQTKEKPSVLKKNRPKGTTPSSGRSSPPGTGKRRDSSPPRVHLPAHNLDSSLNELKLASSSDAATADKGNPEPYNNLPPSRSSAVTNNTNNTPSESGTRSSTPRSLSESVDTSGIQSDGNFASIMSRKRPVPTGGIPGKKPVRKPTPSQAVQQAAQEAASRSLSPEPPAEQPKDHIEALEQRQESLFKRRANITTIINELDQVFQPSAAAYDMSARDEVKKTINGLNNELAEIRREEHEVGLKLLRAWKKRDEKDLYGGGTGLWVKRVTS